MAKSGEAAKAAFPRRVLNRWRGATRTIGVVQTRLIMSVVYASVVLPVGFAFRSARDPLRLQRPAGGNWTDCESREENLTSARRQF